MKLEAGRFSRRLFLGGATAFFARPLFGADETTASLYETPCGWATDAVWVRRVYLDLAGRLPTVEEARAFADAYDPGKRATLVERLLAADSFADYWSLRFCDLLRVKSEFPINLWPNAVYVYHRRIRDFVLNDEPWPHFARALLLSSGSDFREAESNFYRATSRRTPEGYAEIALQTFLGDDWRTTYGSELTALADLFRNVRIKHTREWKEEVVTVEGPDRRAEFCDRLTGVWREAFERAFVRRVNGWLLSSEKSRPADEAFFRKNGGRLKGLVRRIVLSDDYARGPVTGGFPCRRLDAEVLDDVICDLTGATRDYQSIAPEPFTFLPPERRSVLIEDGSVSNAFLTLFGRPTRDTGLLSERHNGITAKQRLYLFNSGRLHRLLDKMMANDELLKKGATRARIDRLYWRFLSRPVSKGELARLMERFNALPTGRPRWGFVRDVAWALLNSREFLYQH